MLNVHFCYVSLHSSRKNDRVKQNTRALVKLFTVATPGGGKLCICQKYHVMKFSASYLLATARRKRQVGSEIFYAIEYTIQIHISRTLIIIHRRVCYEVLMRKICSDFMPNFIVCAKFQYMNREFYKNRSHRVISYSVNLSAYFQHTDKSAYIHVVI
jgi:hypothetical protein